MVRNLQPLRLPCQRALESTFGTLIPKRSVKSPQLTKSYSGKTPKQRDLVCTEGKTQRVESGKSKIPIPQLDLNIPDEIGSVDQNIGNKTCRVGYDGNKIYIPKLDLSFLNESQMIEKQIENSLCHEGIKVLDTASLGHETYRVFKKKGEPLVPFLDLSLPTDILENVKHSRESDTYRVDEQSRISQKDVLQSKTFRIDQANSPLDVKLVNGTNSFTAGSETYRVPRKEKHIPPLDLGFLDDNISSHTRTKEGSHVLNEFQSTRENRTKIRGFCDVNSPVTPGSTIISHGNNQPPVKPPSKLADTYRVDKKVQHETSTTGVKFNGILIPPRDLSFLDDDSEGRNRAKFTGRLNELSIVIQI